MKTISFEEAKPGDWLVSDGGSVRLRIETCGPNVITPLGELSRTYDGWQRYGFHVEREDPPKVVRVDLSMGQIIIGTEAASIRGDFLCFEDSTPLTALIFPADLLNELDEAAREWLDDAPIPCEKRLRRAFAACGIGTPKSGEGASQ